MLEILVEANNLICKDGEVCIWRSDKLETVNFFATKEDAQKYIELRRQWKQENGMEVESYSIGTEDDYMAEVKKYEAEKKANEAKEYCQHVDALIGCRKREIKALDGLIQVCRQFDGKVLNKRFHDAVKEATGLYNSFCEYHFKLEPYDYNNRDYCNQILLSADWSHGINRYTGQKQDMKPDVWQWNTGDRLEAEKAVTVIECYKNYRQRTIEDLRASKKKYAAYLQLARKAEAIMKEMEGYGYEIREFAQEKALSQHSRHSYFWKGY